MVADTPSSNTLSIIKRKEFQEDPYAGQSRYKHKLKRPSVCFFVLLPPSIFRLVLTPRRNVWLRDRWPTQSAHTAVFFSSSFPPPWCSRPAPSGRANLGEWGAALNFFLSFPDCRWPAQQQTVYCTTYSERLISQLDCRCCPADGNNVHISIGRKKKEPSEMFVSVRSGRRRLHLHT